MAEALSDDHIGAPMDQFHEVGNISAVGLARAPEVGIGWRLVGDLRRHARVGRGVGKELRDESVEFPAEAVVIAPTEGAAADRPRIADVVAAIDHEVDGVLVGHALKPPLAYAKRHRRVRARDDDELPRVVGRIEGGEIANVSHDLTGEERLAAAGGGPSSERGAMR